jgi:hypothetical protein
MYRVERSIPIIKFKFNNKEVRRYTFFCYQSTICVIIVFLLTIFPEPAKSQEKLIDIYPTLGLTWRSTAMNNFNFGAVLPDDPTKYYPYEKNVQGFSLNTGIQLDFWKSFVFEYVPNLRYDVSHFRFNGSSDEVMYLKEFMIDHNLNIAVRKKLLYGGVGLSIINVNKGYAFENPIGVSRYHDIEFTTYNAFITFPIKKVLNLEFKVLYSKNNFPFNKNEEYLMYSFRLFYTFDFLNKIIDKRRDK